GGGRATALRGDADGRDAASTGGAQGAGAGHGAGGRSGYGDGDDDTAGRLAGGGGDGASAGDDGVGTAGLVAPPRVGAASGGRGGQRVRTEPRAARLHLLTRF